MSSIIQAIEKNCQERSAGIAICDEEQSYSYGQLKADVEAVIQHISDNGLECGETAAIYIEDRYFAIVALVALQKLGCGYLPLDPVYPEERLKYMLSDSGCRLLLHDGLVIPGSQCSCLNVKNGEFEKAESEPEKYTIDAPGYTIYTSGSTGTPKGVELTLPVLENLIQWQNGRYASSSALKTAQFSALSFDVSFQEIFSTLTQGGTLVLIPAQVKKDFRQLLAYLVAHNVQRVFMPYIALLNLAQWACRLEQFPIDLIEVITAGEQLICNEEIKQFFSQCKNARLFNQYGPSESHVVSEFALPERVSEWPRIPPIGKAISHAKLLVVDDQLNLLDQSEGELLIAGPVIANGYRNKETQTRERFIELTVQGQTHRCYRTGDLVECNASGDFQYKGRIDSQVKISGYRVELDEVEVALMSLSKVDEAAVSVFAEATGDKKLIGFVVSQAAHVDPQSLLQALSDQLPHYMVPSKLIHRDSLLRTPSGKIDRRTMVEQWQQSTTSTKLNNEKNSEAALLGIIRTQLSDETIGPSDNLLDVGMDSMAANHMSARCYDELSLDVPAYLFFQYRTISDLLKAVTQRQERSQHNKKSQASTGSKDIAVIGVSLRTPGAENLIEFWQLISEGKEAIHEFAPVTEEGWVNARGILKQPTGLDAPFFRLTPGEAEMIDPQQRLLLELSWEALEDGGITAEEFAGRVGVFCGTGNNSYYLNNVLKNAEKLEEFGAFQAMVANEKDYSATRIAHKLNLRGPAVNVQSACSTSLVAICQAVQSLRAGECDLALAGGASIYYPQQQPTRYEEGAINSKDGHTRTFDADASGTVFSDGGAVILLKNLDQAIADSDTVYGVIKGVGLNNDGAEKGSFSAPSIEGQKRVIQAAQQDAGVNARQIEYIEAHGTATPIGDPIEVAALKDVFEADTNEKHFCRLGSVKSNFGHLTAAAGVVGVVKSLLAIQRGEHLPLVNFKTPNPALKLDSSPFVIQADRAPWVTSVAERMAGVSSFGIGGTNAHVVLAGFESHTHSAQTHSNPFPLCLSAKSKQAALAYALSYRTWLSQHPDVDVNELALQVVQTRQPMSYRIAVAGSSVDELMDSLAEVNVATKAELDRTVVFAFPGQGAQLVGMGRSLYQNSEVFRENFDACAKAAKQHDVQLNDLVFKGKGDLTATQNTQLALFSLGYSLAKCLESYGIFPDALIGHSIGELCAATIAGVFDLDSAIQVVYWRGKFMQAQPSGSMAAVRAELGIVEPLLAQDVEIAAVNTQDAITITGNDTAIDETIQALEANGVTVKKLETSHAFHSNSMDPAAKAFSEALASIVLHKPEKPFISCVTGDWITDAQAISPEYWGRQIRQPVHFLEGAKAVLALRKPVVFELGPKTTAIGMINLVKINDDDLSELTSDVVSLLPRPGTETETMDFTAAIGKAWAAGVDVQPLDSGLSQKINDLPTYPFQRKNYEIQPDGYVQPPQLSNQSFAKIDLQNAGVTNVKDQVISQLKTLLAETSGMDLDDASTEATFFEIGFDSLFLTQCIAKIKKQFKVQVTFRELMNDHNSLSKLADHMIEKGVQVDVPSTAPSPAIPPAAQAPQIPVMPQASQMTSAQPIVAGDNQLVHLFSQQMDLINAQIAMLQGQGYTAGVAQSVANSAPEQPVAVSTPAAPKKIKPFGAGVRINVNRTNELTKAQQANLDSLTERYVEKFSESKNFAQENRKQLADPRVVSGFRPTLKELVFPIVVNKSDGAYLWDIQGNQFVDVTCGFGSNFFGHGAPFVKEAVAAQLEGGYEIGPQHPLVADVSKKFCQVTGLDRVAFCNTGSEAVLGAVRLARTVTAKDHVVMFENDYHGINDEVILHRGGDGHSAPAAAGIPEAAVENTMMLDYGDEKSLAYIEEHSDDIAAVLIEPVQSRKPNLQPKAFIQKLRDLCDKHDIALIFDEVITGFRIHSQGAQGFYGIRADIATYGKVIGGGMPIGVIAGTEKYMDALDGGTWRFGDDSAPEVGVTYFAGTFVRHPFALAAANAVLDKLIADPDCQQRLNSLTESMVNEINSYIDKIGAPMKVVYCGSLFRFDIPQNIGYEELIYVLLREKGIHIWDARPCFLTLAHSQKDVDQIVTAVKESIDDMLVMGFFPPIESKTTQDNQSASADGQQVMKPPVPGARLGRDENGQAAWYVPSSDNPDDYVKWQEQ